MKKSTKLALAFIALAGAVGTAAYADEHAGWQRRDRMPMRLDKALDNAGGSISFEQFSNVMDTRLKKMVADNGGKLTVEQLANALERERFQRMARRIIARYDAKDEGTLTTDDIAGREKKLFAMLDKNNDGKIEKNELPKGRFGQHRSMDDDDAGGVQ